LSDLTDLVKLAKHINDHPWSEQILAEQYPREMDRIAKLSRAPFIRWAPFGFHNGVRFGGYREDGTNPCQVGFLASNARNKWCTSGNRGGKSLSGCMEDFGDAIHLNPITKMPDTYRYEDKAIRIWVVSDTEETSINGVEQIFYEQVLGPDEDGAMWNFIDDGCNYTPKSGWSGRRILFTNGSWIQFKFSTQGRRTFQGVSLDKVHIDEVQPQPIYSECSARLTDRNGYLLGTMTPLDDKGVPWIYEELYIPREEKNIEFHQWSMYDNPHLSPEGRDRLIRQWDEDEVEARVYGSFVPIGHKLAFSHAMIRRLRDQVEPPMMGDLMYNEKGMVEFLEQDAIGTGQGPQDEAAAESEREARV
jgi:phage terminase large subunit-like protein